ncbi:hypothetical protein FO519_006906 [Halicephalobus sp. NKZ332]|nr:hypothetical protein FO519_006906 [Halicephalobus sp. NKZ332]
MLRTVVLVLIGVLGVVAELQDNIPAVGFKCKQPNMTGVDLPLDIALKMNYQATIRYTNWDKSITALLTERNFTDLLLVEKTDRNGATSYIVRNDGVITFNNTNCSNNTKDTVLPQLYPFDPFLEANILNNSTNLASIVNSVISSQSKLSFKGLVEAGVVGGIDAVGWIGCWFNATGDNQTGVQIEVFYAGDKSQPPYSADYKNPTLLSLHLSLFKGNTSGGEITSHFSLDVVELEKTDENKKNEAASVPRGVYCDGMKLENLSTSIPERFGASLDFVNTQTKQIDSAQILYDNLLKITSFSLDFNNDKDIPFIAGVDLPKNLTTATIYRDFVYGIQYVLSKDSRVCRSVESLDPRFNDAITNNGTVELRSPEDILLNVSGIQFYNSGKKVIEGVSVDSYLAKKEESNGGFVLVEVNFIQDDWSVENVKGRQIHSIAHFHKDKDSKLVSETYIHFDSFQNYTALGPLWIKSNVFPCTTESVEDNFFFLNLKNASLKNIKDYGTENVESALAEAISKAGNVSVLRISYFMLKQDNAGETLACFLIGDKSPVKQTQTAYLKPELSLDEFRKIINDTVTTSGIVANLVTEYQKEATIGIDKFGVINTHDDPHPPGPKFVGYSGGAIALGVYLFYNKRRTIGGMAYQVFE